MAAGDASFTEILESTQTREHMPVDVRLSPIKVTYVRLSCMWPHAKTQLPAQRPTQKKLSIEL